jgi:hypothetical protein
MELEGTQEWLVGLYSQSHVTDSRAAFGGFKFLQSGQDIDDPHYQGSYPSLPPRDRDQHTPAEMRKYPEVPQTWYGAVFLGSLAVGVGLNYSTGTSLMPWWCIIVFTLISALLSVLLGFRQVSPANLLLPTDCVRQ